MPQNICAMNPFPTKDQSEKEKSHNSAEREQWKTYHLITWKEFEWHFDECMALHSQQTLAHIIQTSKSVFICLSTWFLNYYNSFTQ